MFAVVRTQAIPLAGSGFRSRLAGRLRLLNVLHSGARVMSVKRFGMRLLEAEIDLPAGIGENRARHRAAGVLQKLSQAGVRTVVCDASFPYPDLLEAYRLGLPDRSVLLRKTAGQIALAALGPGALSRTAAVYADRLTPEVDDAIRFLLPRVRHLALFCGRRREEYARGLLREFGISVMTQRQASHQADVHLLFAGVNELPAPKTDAVAVCLSGVSQRLPIPVVRDAEFLLPFDPAEADGYPAQMLISALEGAGAITARDLKIRQLLISYPAYSSPFSPQREEIPAALDKDAEILYNTF